MNAHLNSAGTFTQSTVEEIGDTLGQLWVLDPCVSDNKAPGEYPTVPAYDPFQKGIVTALLMELRACYSLTVLRGYANDTTKHFLSALLKFFLSLDWTT